MVRENEQQQVVETLPEVEEISDEAVAKAKAMIGMRLRTEQYVRDARYDCDMDVLLFVVEQEGRGACHTGSRSCFFRAFGDGFTSQSFVQDHGDAVHRRSLYTFWKRTAPPPEMITFDAPDREKCTARRTIMHS